MKHAGVFELSFSPMEGHSLDELAAAIDEELERLRTTLFLKENRPGC